MRILSLDLLAWGPFSSGHLDFSTAPNAVHLVFGENEAGKSTTLRAIRALLYGVDVRPVDAHRHPGSDLRIGGRLAGPDGELVDVVRRKGNKNTLLGPDGAPVDEALLRRLLGGVGAEQFSLLYGLDHASLREGGTALLHAGGEIGASLYGAALGAAGLGAAAKALREEAEELWTAKAKDRPLVKALRELVEKQREAREAVKPPSHHQQLVEDLRAAEAAEAEAYRALDKKRRERARVERLLTAAGLIAHRRRATVERAALGVVPSLRPGIGAEREAAQRGLHAAETQVTSLTERIGRLAEQRAVQRVDDDFLAAAPAIVPLREALERAQRAVGTLPANRARAAQLSRDVEATRARLGASVTALAPDAGVLVRLRAMAAELPGRRRTVDESAREVAALVARVETRATELTRAAPTVDAATLARLRAALVGVERAADLLSQRRRDLRDRDKTAKELARKRAALPTPVTDANGSLEALVARAPLDGELDLAGRAKVAADEAAARADEALSSTKARLAEATRALRLLVAARDVPTEDDLIAARAERDRAVDNLGAMGDLGPLAGRALPETIATMRASIAKADAIADRLRREARDVADKARLVEEERLARAALVDAEARARNAHAERDVASAAFAHLFFPLGIAPSTSGDALTLLSRLRDAAALEGRLREFDDAIARTDALEGELTQSLAAALDEAEPTRLAAQGGGDHLDALAARAHLIVESAAESERRRADLERAMSDDTIALAEARARATNAQRHELELLDPFRAELARLGLAPETNPAEAIEILSTHSSLAEHERELRRLSHDIARDEGIIAALSATVTPLVATLAPDLASRLPIDAATELIHRFQQASAQAENRKTLDDQLVDTRAELARFENERAAAAARLAALCAEAGVADAAALADCETRAARAAQLAREIAELDLQLSAVADGRTIEELETEAGGDEALTALEARKRGLDDDDLPEAERQVLDAREDTKECKKNLDLYANSIGAAELAAAAQEKIAEARTLLERYVRLRAAGVILDRQIERYRATHQGPILDRASTIFTALTGGRYTGLRAELDERDEVVLQAVLPDGARKIVTALSDGRRDQLFLALRLATIEEIAARNRPGADLPLVLDDIFVHFDDPSSRAGLTVLGELAARAQIILFTHHARLVELAREAVPASRLRVHRLGGSGSLDTPGPGDDEAAAIAVSTGGETTSA